MSVLDSAGSIGGVGVVAVTNKELSLLDDEDGEVSRIVKRKNEHCNSNKMPIKIWKDIKGKDLKF